MTPKIRPLVPRGSTLEETIEEKIKVPRRATIRASFVNHFPSNAGISLHPMQCWLVNERRQSRRLVLDYGSPLLDTNNETIVSLSAESASSTTGDHPYVAFNADASLFGDEDGAHPFDLPSFRLQCSVWPCKGLPLHQQIIGVPRCPSVAWCEMGKKILVDSIDKFEVDQLFSLSISSSIVAEKDYNPLGSSFVFLPPV
ncbi:hypothetical protein PMAYCL1PPCAC_28800 [Pristionchus mayeri]|uniref:Uncharacterized protein n=1 Tax=Pristionchus mayeri TaxID=1317129 RepID=A0AAN5IC15_9BILA|nr:hypothetical protein PMAYCL1PPCAC_28800 [Pristionchus mayeri]